MLLFLATHLFLLAFHQSRPSLSSSLFALSIHLSHPSRHLFTLSIHLGPPACLLGKAHLVLVGFWETSYEVCKKKPEMSGFCSILHRPAETQHPASMQREQNFISLAQFNEAFRLYIPVLLAFLQLNSPPQSKIHPANLYSFSFMVASLIYYLSFIAYTQLNISHLTYSQLFGVIAFISGSLSSTLLVSNLLSNLTKFIILILWALLSILVVHQHVPLNKKEVYEKLGEKMKNMFNEAYEKLGEKMKNVKISEKISSLWSKNEPGLPRDK
ncbi:hypothetical protein Pint_19632 [Pistacia integerrima]|uniref:Uncharacterized protein n=1 Tax=Pistacia integerrima TaxID=434235 RepID=A0ACC0XBV0_9ROSI|nr:hypothetical protein Pint_19632 [Pistacia integerrima]